MHLVGCFIRSLSRCTVTWEHKMVFKKSFTDHIIAHDAHMKLLELLLQDFHLHLVPRLRKSRSVPHWHEQRQLYLPLPFIDIYVIQVCWAQKKIFPQVVDFRMEFLKKTGWSRIIYAREDCLFAVGFTAQPHCRVGAHYHCRITGGNNSKSRKGDKLLKLNRPCRGFALRSGVGNERTVLWLLVC